MTNIRLIDFFFDLCLKLNIVQISKQRQQSDIIGFLIMTFSLFDNDGGDRRDVVSSTDGKGCVGFKKIIIVSIDNTSNPIAIQKRSVKPRHWI